MTSTTTEARARTFARTRRAVVALGLVSALSGGLLVAHAPQASAATSAQTATQAKKPKIVTKLNHTTLVKGKTYQTVWARAGSGGHAVHGTARLVVNGKVVGSKKLNVWGKVLFHPASSKFKMGKNRVRVLIVPNSGSGYAAKYSATRIVTKKLPGSPVAKLASKYVGARYVHGGSSPSGFDCSGFTSYVYRKAIGKSLPRTSSGQKAAGHTVSRSQARAGDIIWTPGHVSIYIGNGKQIEAARPGVGVVKRAIWQDNPRFIRVSKAAIGA